MASRASAFGAAVLLAVTLSACGKKVVDSAPSSSDASIAAQRGSDGPQNEPLPSQQNPEPSLPFTVCNSTSPPSLGGARLTILCSAESETKPFVAPYLRVDWEAAQASLDQLCKGGMESKHPVRLPIRLEMMAPAVIDEAEQELVVNRFFGDRAQKKLYPYPYSGIAIKTAIATDTPRIVYTYPAGWKIDSDSRRAIPVIFPTDLPPFVLNETCSRLSSIIDTKDLHGELYFNYVTILRNSFSANIRQYIDSRYYSDIFRKQEAGGGVSVTTSGKSSGGGINLGFASYGRGKSSGTTTTIDSRHRYTTENVIADSVEEFTSSLNANAWVEFSGGTISKKDFMDLLVAGLLKDARDVEHAVRIEKNGTITLIEGELEATLGVEQTNLIMETKPGVYDASGKDQAKVTIGAYGGEESHERTVKIGLGPEVKWRRDGQTWVPHSVKLKAISEVSASTAKDLLLSEARATYGTGYATIPLQDIYSTIPSREGQPVKGVIALTPEQLKAVPDVRAIAQIAKANAKKKRPPYPDGALCTYAMFTATTRDRNRMAPLVLLPPEPLEVGGKRLMYKVLASAKQCPGIAEMPGCVHVYVACFARDVSRGCLIRDRWLRWSVEQTRGVPAPVDVLCEEQS
ncbi:hypothetical protein [Lysobacter soli]|uniref:hypothetical protein n=1 Tax=Lysobacter soli TaxID=453783 RepID=UPI00241079EF|nr:hypothetical protein [Lysobacter soli]MDG2517364.1 hypothetical protein [Lysobacter soli]